MTIQESKHLSIVDYLRHLGHAPTRVQGACYWYLSPLRKERTASFKVNTYMNKWIDYGSGEHGDILDLCRRLQRLSSTAEALQVLDAYAEATPVKWATTAPTPRALAEAALHSSLWNSEKSVCVNVPLGHPALKQYLHQRGVDAGIASKYCQEMRCTRAGKVYFGISFANLSGGHELRNAYFKGCVGRKDVTYIRHDSMHHQPELCIFEGFMDFLSYATLRAAGNRTICLPYECDILVLNSTNCLQKGLLYMEGYRLLHGYLDNDDTGRKTWQLVGDLFGHLAEDEAWRYAPDKDVNAHLMRMLATGPDSKPP